MKAALVLSFLVIAELKGEATQCDASSLRVCTYVYMYVCILCVYPSYSTQDTLIVQLTAVCGHLTRQLRFTPHHHWPQIDLLYYLIAVRCVQLCLLPKHVLNGYRHIFNYGCVHSLHVARAPAPAPAPRESAQCPCSVYSCTNMWGPSGQHVHLCSRSLMPSKLSHKRFLHPTMSITLAKLTQSRTRDTR